MRHFLLKNWFILGMVVTVTGGLVWPELGPILKQGRVLNIGVFICFFLTGLTLQTSVIFTELKNVKALTTALLSCFALFPVVALLLARLVYSSDGDFVTGVCILAVQPVTVASGTVLTRVAKGNVALSLLINVATNLLAIFTIPLALGMMLDVQGEIELPILRMIGSLVMMVLLPTILGQVAGIWWREKSLAHKKWFSVFAQVVVLLVIFSGVAGSTEKIQEMGWQIASLLVFVLVLHGLALGMNVGLARLIGLDRAGVTVFVLHVSQKSLTIAFIVWSGYFAEEFPLALIPTIGYHLVQLVVDSVLAERLRRSAERAGGEE